MDNDYFQFKQFRVVQRQAGMKVTTDSCVFGALLKNILPVEKINLLDIGTGTGLLALMVAQLRPEARMTAVEVDVEAFRQAQENIGKSPWSDRITLVHQAVQEYQKTASKKFEVIISNPPFYAAHQHSLDSRRAKAHHTVTLSQADLAATVEHLLMPDGIFVVLLPSFEMEKLRNELKQ
ncbi:MAG: methyltransferase, partial [Bacteroidota bacterium]